MKSKKQLLKKWKIYAILDNSLFADKRELFKTFLTLLQSPVDAIQLRFDNITDPLVYRMTKKMAIMARRKAIALIINDRPEIALSLGADGVHLGRADVPADLARKILSPCAIIGKTIRSGRCLKAINKKSVDYAAIGPVFNTPLKPDLKAISRATIRNVCKANILPLVAIGGINDKNIRQVKACGIKTVAFTRYAITQKDTRQRIEKLRKGL